MSAICVFDRSLKPHNFPPLPAMKEIDDLNDALLKLWEKQPPNDPFVQRMPLFYSLPVPESILFVGINPSFSDIGFKKILGKDYPTINPHEFFKFPRSEQFDMATCIEIEKRASEQHRYFAKFREIASKLSMPWHHIDLLSIRHTKQADVRRYIFGTGKEKDDLKAFASEQIDLATIAIKLSEPKAIVVANALASRIFYTKLKPEFDNATGCHRMIIAGAKVPVFFTSMLTGQRALDNYSYQRLIWHLRFALEKLDGTRQTTE
jgi:hypothetical protein